MASPFAEAITQSMIAGLDPMNGVVKDYARQTIATQQVALDEAKLEMMDKLQLRIDKATADGSDQTIITAYQKMLARYAG